MIAAIAMTAAAIGSVFYFSDDRGTAIEVFADRNRRVIRVPAGSDVQAAIDKAESGDVIELEAGAVYHGGIVLPKKSLTDFVTIRSSAAGKLPEDQRIKPEHIRFLAKIQTKNSDPAVRTENGAHHYRFVGVEFAPASAEYVYNLVLFGDPQKPSDVPHHLEIDRSVFRPHKSGKTRRGLALNSADTVIKNSRFEGFAFPGEETQGIAGWTGTRNVKIIDNHIEGGAENILFGGSDPASPDLIPQDIEIRGNYLVKPAEWKGKATIKTLFELKNAKRVRFTENYLQNNWEDSAFRITVRNQDGKAAFSTIEDVTIARNVIDGAGAGVNILGKDDTYESRTLDGLFITDNLFLNVGTENFEGGGYFIQISGGRNIEIVNNTVFNAGNIVSFHGTPPDDFLFLDNIVGHGNYGIHGLPDIKSSDARKIFQNNVIVNNRNVGLSDTSFPPGNFWVSNYAGVGFIGENDFRLAENSRFKKKGGDGKDIGSSLDAETLVKRLKN